MVSIKIKEKQYRMGTYELIEASVTYVSIALYLIE